MKKLLVADKNENIKCNTLFRCSVTINFMFSNTFNLKTVGYMAKHYLSTFIIESVLKIIYRELKKNITEQ